jgi:hypothetical protein
MKPITIKQWEKMPSRGRDWLVVKALEFPTWVFWHVSLDGSHEKICSGSYPSETKARAVLNYPPNNFPETAILNRSFSFWLVSTVPNCAQSVIDAMLKRGWSCRLEFNPLHQPAGFRTAQFYKSGDESFFFDSTTIENAICAAALQALGFMELYPF